MRWSRQGPFDPEAFDSLVGEYADRLYSVALRITRSHEEAEDATQDAFLSAFRHRADFRGQSDVASWLFRITVNAALQRVRRHRPAEYLTGDEEATPRRLDWADDPARRLEMGELRDTIEDGIGLLPEDLRVALVLRDVEQLSTAETAAILDLSEAAVKSRLHRARLLLRRYLVTTLAGESF